MPLRLNRKSRFRQPFDPVTAVLFKFLQGSTFLFVLAMIFMNPVVKKGIINPKAEYIITVRWPDWSPDDIDTWVETPSDDVVWFRNRDAGLVHLDRDDRGMLNDTITVNGKKIVNPLNQEVVTIRGIVPGQYVVNIYYYASADGKKVPVNIRLDKVNPVLKVLYYRTMILTHQGEERTVMRFSMRPDGTVYDINQIPKSLAGRYLD